MIEFLVHLNERFVGAQGLAPLLKFISEQVLVLVQDVSQSKSR
jgi:hypothetical protein